MKTRDDDLKAAKGIIDGVLMSIPIWFIIIGLGLLVFWAKQP
jgi:hypothetical protein